MIARPYTKHIFLIGCAVLFLAGSLLLYRAIGSPSSHLDIDSIGYDRIATHFEQTTNLSDPHDLKSAPIQPIGYPLFLGLIYKTLGHDYAYIVIIQLCIMLLVGFGILKIAQQLFNADVALLSIFLCLITLGFYVYPQLLLAEVLCLFFFMAFFERFLFFLKTGNRTSLWLAGFLLGISVLIKPMALLYIFFLIPLLLFYKKNTDKPMRNCLILLISFYTPIISYMTYNYYRYDTFALAPMTELNIYQCFLSKVIAHVEHVPVQQVLENQLAFKGSHSFDSSGWNDAKALFNTYATQNPWACVRVWGTNVAKTLVGLYATQLKLLLNPALKGGDHSFFKVSGTIPQRMIAYITQGTSSKTVLMIAYFEAIWSIIRWLLVLIAFFILFKKKQFMLCWLFGSFILQSALVTGMDGCCRYRIMFEPFLVILAALTIISVYQWIKHKHTHFVCERYNE